MKSGGGGERRLVIVLWAGAGGLLGAGAVLLGNTLMVPGFSLPSGFFGTNFLSSMLYSMGSDRGALAVVCFLWSVYGALAFGVFGWAFTRLGKRTPERS